MNWVLMNNWDTIERFVNAVSQNSFYHLFQKVIFEITNGFHFDLQRYLKTTCGIAKPMRDHFFKFNFSSNTQIVHEHSGIVQILQFRLL